MKSIIFTGFQKGLNKEGVTTYKCFFKTTDKFGFTTTVVKYLSEEEFKKLPKVKAEVAIQ